MKVFHGMHLEWSNLGQTPVVGVSGLGGWVTVMGSIQTKKLLGCSLNNRNRHTSSTNT